MNDPSDADLVERFLGGDRDAFATLVQRHTTKVYNVAYRMLGRPEDARDAVQEVFLTCLRKLRGFEGRAAFTTWLYRVTVNVCHDALRRRAREQPAHEELPDLPEDDRTEAAAAAADVHRALGAIPEEFRTVLVLHDLQGEPYERIAEVLGAPLGTVKSRLHRGRVALGRALRGEQSGTPTPSNVEDRG
ncbi:MAG TPA: RNA polymerase sigma factor [Actinomycetota bacterium]|nr:RNA polymerase sigma factor [Actinomycetota bacterium]